MRFSSASCSAVVVSPSSTPINDPFRSFVKRSRNEVLPARGRKGPRHRGSGVGMGTVMVGGLRSGRFPCRTRAARMSPPLRCAALAKWSLMNQACCATLCLYKLNWRHLSTSSSKMGRRTKRGGLDALGDAKAKRPTLAHRLSSASHEDLDQKTLPLVLPSAHDRRAADSCNGQKYNGKQLLAESTRQRKCARKARRVQLAKTSATKHHGDTPGTTCIATRPSPSTLTCSCRTACCPGQPRTPSTPG